MEQRKFARRSMRFPLGVESPGSRRRRIAVVRDVSEGGLLIGTYGRFRVGEKLTLAWRASGKDGRRTRVHATVVRVSSRPRGARTSFPYVHALEFERPLSKLPFPSGADEGAPDDEAEG